MPRKPRFGSIYRRKKKQEDGTTAELPTWWIQYRANGRKVRESSRSSRYSDAERLLRKRVSEISSGVHIGPAIERVLVAELLDDLLSDYEENNKSINWARIVDAHLRSFFRMTRAINVGTHQLQAYARQRREQGVGNSTINREIGQLKRAFNLASQATPPKARPLPWFGKLAEPPPRKGFFEYDDFQALRSELPEHLRPVITFAYYTGCRKGEILNLRWSQVDLPRRIVRLEPGETKNDEARTIPLIGELFDMLTLQREKRDQLWPECSWIFCRYGKKIRNFYAAWDEACKRAGLTDEQGRAMRLFHDLRRTGVRNLVRAGVPERVAMTISGHKTRSVFDRYNIVSERDLHDAAAKLERHIAELETSSDGHTLGTPSDRSENQRSRRDAAKVPRVLN